MKRHKSGFIRNLGMLIVLAGAICAVVEAQNGSFHNAPASAKQVKNPYAGQNRAAEIGGQLYAVNCASCHGPQGQGTGNIPALKEGRCRRPATANSSGSSRKAMREQWHALLGVSSARATLADRLPI